MTRSQIRNQRQLSCHCESSSLENTVRCDKCSSLWHQQCVVYETDSFGYTCQICRTGGDQNNASNATIDITASGGQFSTPLSTLATGGLNTGATNSNEVFLNPRKTLPAASALERDFNDMFNAVVVLFEQSQLLYNQMLQERDTGHEQLNAALEGVNNLKQSYESSIAELRSLNNNSNIRERHSGIQASQLRDPLQVDSRISSGSQAIPVRESTTSGTATQVQERSSAPLVPPNRDFLRVINASQTESNRVPSTNNNNGEINLVQALNELLNKRRIEELPKFDGRNLHIWVKFKATYNHQVNAGLSSDERLTNLSAALTDQAYELRADHLIFRESGLNNGGIGKLLW